MSATILCLDDEEEVIVSIRAVLEATSKYYIHSARTWKDARLILETSPIDVLLLDVNLGKSSKSGLDLIPEIRRDFPEVDIIIVTGEREPKLFRQALELGAVDYYQKPIRSDLALALQKVEIRREKDRRCTALFREITEPHRMKELIGRSDEFMKVLNLASRLKGQTASVLIEAETGTGKELLAKYIYQLEEDSKRPFIVINCMTIPETLIDSELFGHEKGAFTGANETKVGKFQLAHGGDIFIDEINSLKLEYQVKLLRVLNDRMVCRLGSKHPEPADFRVIAASNVNLKKLVEEGTFRDDLYHRLNVVKLVLPPLRKRKDDIPDLVDHFLAKYDRSKKKRISAAAMRLLTHYDWPGNVRELENVVQAMVALSPQNVLDVNDLPDGIYVERVHPAVKQAINALETNLQADQNLFNMDMGDFVRILKAQYIKQAIKKHAGNVTETANQLGISRVAIYRILREVKDYGDS